MSRPGWNASPEFDGLVFLGKKGQPQWRSTIASSIETIISVINDLEEKDAEREGRRPRYMDPVLPHTFRHTFATRCLEAGIPPKVVQGWMGHASIKVTLDLYTHVSTELSAEYMSSLENHDIFY